MATPRRLLLLLAAGIAMPVCAQPGPFTISRVEAPADATAIPLYPVGSPVEGASGEVWNRTLGSIGPTRIDMRSVRNVRMPTITPFLPDPAKATGAAVIVAPGGAFLSLSMDEEGFKVARSLADRGIAAFVLKYRLQETPADDAAFMAEVGRVFGEAGKGDARGRPAPSQSVADALQALKIVRARAAEFRVDPAQVGLIGFSAGAQTGLETALVSDSPSRPAFLGFVYGPMRAIPVPADAPPMFAAIALDDGLFGRQGFGIVEAWHQANRPVELHAYERGDHGFGVGRPGTTTMLMIDEFVAWLRARSWPVEAKSR
ncbi:alpha/beta hydrolase [Sphingosinicella sp. BN140058]|uniref:alpha/beta hydrolase n=1 Tax=Sphingosinicella sp. BN140058 TaxID=1892855 RepID=UPI001011D1A1|nr:dienelactone hydrolase family protein [Sphingosinicella sp. BN140058]QAY78114.1 alpha/beta hydrolase [Sphingosinicella sp. BN140058]